MNAKQHKIMGIVALIYALLWGFFLLAHFDFFIIKDGNRITFYERWPGLYQFTFQSSFMMVLWLLLFGIARFVGQKSNLGRFASNNTLLASLTLYSTLLFAYCLFMILNGGFPSYNSISQFLYLGYMPLTYFGSMILMWHLFLLNEKKAPRFRSVFIMMIFPIAYFTLNMVVGHTVTWSYSVAVTNLDTLCPDCMQDLYGNGYPMFAYPFLNPATYPNMTMFVLAMTGIAFVLIAFSSFMIWVKQKQLKTVTANSENKSV
jgi:hypothetical protein